MAKVVAFPQVVKDYRADPQKGLDWAKENLDEYFITGYDKEGHEVFINYMKDPLMVLFMIERLKLMLVSGDDHPDEYEDL